MKRRLFFALFFGLAAAMALTTHAVALSQSAGESANRPRIDAMRMPFVANMGQLPEQMVFRAETLVGNVYVTDKGELNYRLPDPKHPDKPTAGLSEVLVGARAMAPHGLTPSSSRVNLFIGNDPSQWRRGIPSYDCISLGEAYDGITVTLKAHGNNIEKLFHVDPGADPAAIRVRVTGATGLNVLPNGQLAIGTGVGPVQLTRPVAFQEIDGRKIMVSAAYRVEGDTYSFVLGAYDDGHPFVIDPLFATYLGGSGMEYGYGLKTNVITDGVDSHLYIYVTGGTASRNDFPGLNGAAQSEPGWGGQDAFVARLDQDLKVLDTTYIGGRGEDMGWDLTIHPETDDVYVVGSTDSSDFPAASPGGRGGETDGFVIILNPDLSAIHASRYLGGSAYDAAFSLDIDLREEPYTTPDSLYVVGRTMSSDFPVSDSAAQTVHGPNYSLSDGFITRLNIETLARYQSSFLGGSSTDHAHGVEVHDITHEVYVVGQTAYDGRQGIWVGCFPWLDPNDFGGQIDTYVVRMSDDLDEVINAAYVGGSGIDFGMAIALNHSTNQVYVAGGISPRANPSPPPIYLDDFPGTADSFQPNLAGDQDGFIACLTQDLTLEYATHLGGSGFERISDILLSNNHSPAFDVYVIGTTQSNDFPGTETGYSRPQGFYDVFLARFTSNLGDLYDATYLGGSGVDEAQMHTLDIANDPHTGAVWLFAAGNTSSRDFPGVLNTFGNSAAQPTNGGSEDIWVARLNPLYRSGAPDIELQPRSHDFGNQRLNLAATALSVTFDNLGADPLNVGAVFLQGADQEDYTLDFATGTAPCGPPPFDVLSGAVCTVNVIFTPSVDNVIRRAEVVVRTSNDADEPELLIDLQGYSGPDITIITSEPNPEPTVKFPLTEVGTTTTQYFTIQNDGYSDLIITGIAKTGIEPDTGENFTFHYDGPFACPDPSDGPFNLVPRANCQVTVDFSPTYPANQEALAVIFSNDLNENPQLVHIIGPGVEDLTADIWSHDVAFHDVPIGSSRSLPVIVTNTGGEVLEILGFALSDTTNFSIDTSGGAIPCDSVGNELEPFSSCTLTATFHPIVAASFDEALTYTSNDPDEAEYAIRLTGRSSADSDGDYVLDVEEIGDANGDGIADAQQANVATLHSLEGGHYVVMETEGGAELRDVRSRRSPTDAPLVGFEYPFGFFSFRVILGATDDGANITMTVMNADGTPADDIDTYIKYGPTPGEPGYHYYDLGALGGVVVNGVAYPSYVTTAANVVTLHLLDGGMGDSDDGDGDGQGEVNGEIVDPGAPARVYMAVDSDGDGVLDDADNCPAVSNSGQENVDGDGLGDACDSCPQDADNDADGDGICADADNCPVDANASQADADGDLSGDACDTCINDADNDMDSDGVCGDVDNCPNTANAGQEDADGNGVGDACETQPAGSGDSGGGGGGGCFVNEIW